MPSSAFRYRTISLPVLTVPPATATHNCPALTYPRTVFQLILCARAPVMHLGPFSREAGALPWHAFFGDGLLTPQASKSKAMV